MVSTYGRALDTIAGRKTKSPLKSSASATCHSSAAWCERLSVQVTRREPTSKLRRQSDHSPDGLEFLREPDPDRPSPRNRHDLFVNREPLRLQAFAIEREGRGQLRRAE